MEDAEGAASRQGQEDKVKSGGTTTLLTLRIPAITVSTSNMNIFFFLRTVLKNSEQKAGRVATSVVRHEW